MISLLLALTITLTFTLGMWSCWAAILTDTANPPVWVHVGAVTGFTLGMFLTTILSFNLLVAMYTSGILR
jgi:hypothetical protein